MNTIGGKIVIDAGETLTEVFADFAFDSGEMVKHKTAGHVRFMVVSKCVVEMGCDFSRMYLLRSLGIDQQVRTEMFHEQEIERA